MNSLIVYNLAFLGFALATTTSTTFSATITTSTTPPDDDIPYASTEIGKIHAYNYSRGTAAARPITLAVSIATFTASAAVLVIYAMLARSSVQNRAITKSVTIALAPIMAISDSVLALGNILSYNSGGGCSIWIWMYVFGSNAGVFLATAIAYSLRQTFLAKTMVTHDPMIVNAWLISVPLVIALITASAPLLNSMYVWRYDLVMCWWWGEDHPVPGAYAIFNAWVWPTFYGPQLICIAYGVLVVFSATAELKRTMPPGNDDIEITGFTTTTSGGKEAMGDSVMERKSSAVAARKEKKIHEETKNDEKKKKSIVSKEKKQIQRFFYRCILFPLIPLLCNLPTILASVCFGREKITTKLKFI
jgi:hypothetical protein